MHYLGRASLEAEQKYRVPCSRPTNATTREVGEHATRYRIESHSKYKWRTYGQWKKQLALEVGEDGQTLLTMDVYDAGQNRIAQLRRNAWLFNDSDRFNITTNPKSLKLIDTATEETVVEVNTLSRTQMRISHGNFYTSAGDPIEITPSYLRVRGMTASGNVFDGLGGAFTITPQGISIGLFK